jgi:hypothetical protein
MKTIKITVVLCFVTSLLNAQIVTAEQPLGLSGSDAVLTTNISDAIVLPVPNRVQISN